MNNEYNQLIQIRQQKEQQQRILVQQVIQEIAEKKSKLGVLEQSMELFKQQKSTLEKVFFSQIEGQQIKPESLAEYQEKVRQVNQFEIDLNAQRQAVIEDISTTEAYLAEQKQELITATNDVEKIGILVEEQQKVTNEQQRRNEEAQSDEQATEMWNRN
jgi:hypothetical protein